MDQITSLLQVGAQFEMYGSPFEVTAVKNDEVRLAPMNGGAIAHLKFKAISGLLEGHKIVVTYLPRDLAARGLQSLRGLTEAQRVHFARKLHYVRGVVSAHPDAPCAQRKIKAAITSLAAEIHDQDPPGPSTIAGWIQKWLRAGRDEYVLLPATKPSRKDYSEVDSVALEIVSTSIEQVYLNRHRNSAKAVYADVGLRIANYNVGVATPVPIPSEYIVRKIIKEIDAYERDRRRYGKAYANRRHRAVGRAILATEPLDLCMADGQHLDVMVVDAPADGSPPKVLGRPFLTIILDVRTRCILGAYVSLQPFCGGTVLKAMTEAVVADPGRPRGIMSTLIVDNGCDYQDSGFMRFVSTLDVSLEICGPRMPNGKAHVERVFLTLNRDLIHKLPGTTFSNPAERGDYRSQDFAQLTLDDLRAKIQTWIDEVYHRRPHRTLNRAPIDVWNEETAA